MPRQSKSSSKNSKPKKPYKLWGTENSEVPQYVKQDLYEVYHFLGKKARQRMGLMMKVPVFIQDPQVGLDEPNLCVQEIDVRLEAGMSHGPTSARIAVVDYNADTRTMIAPVTWDAENGWFRIPQPEGQWLPDRAPKQSTEQEVDQEAAQAVHRQFIESLVKNPHFHQVNVWAVVQRVLEFYQDPQALGRPIPWGFNGNRLIIFPHAGYGNNAFYDPDSKSLKFYYFGDQQNPGYTCLSHDIIAHETGHAILDGIRPHYKKASSVQAAAFHEFIGDLTAILLALFNQDIREHLAKTTLGDLSAAEVLSSIAEEFGEQVEDRPYLRSASNKLSMQEVQNSLSPHHVSQVLTAAMFEILIEIAKKRVQWGEADETGDGQEERAETHGKPESPAKNLWRTADSFRRIALQPLDICPPCDIQFLDYASAVLRNDELTNPVDSHGYRQIMLDVFHRRGLCPCSYEPGNDLPEECLFGPAFDFFRLRLVYHDIGRVSRSRTAAYYFLSDNREVLRIPAHQDVVVVDLYDNNKSGAAAVRLPREVVLEYLWQEEVQLDSSGFGHMNGKKVSLYCGGTLVFDDRGNLLSWFRKPGTQHISPEKAQELQQRQQAWQNNPVEAQRNGIKNLTIQERGELEDYQIGAQRKADLKKYIAEIVRRGLASDPQHANPLTDEMKPLIAIEEDGVVEFKMKPQLRKSDFDTEQEGWTVNH